MSNFIISLDFELKWGMLDADDTYDKNLFGVKKAIPQILNSFEKYNVKNFSILEIWNELLKKNELNGFESLNKFYHLTDLEIFKKLKDF